MGRANRVENTAGDGKTQESEQYRWSEGRRKKRDKKIVRPETGRG